jgi:Lon protease-like protein
VPQDRLPLFPLPNVVLYPGCVAPLHVFEPRYRQLAAEVLEGERRIGMVAVRPEHVDETAGNPPIYEVGCAGFVTEHRKLADGRYNLILRGTHRFRILREELPDGERLYRVAETRGLDDPGSDDPRNDALRRAVLERLGEVVRRAGADGLEELPLERLERLDHASFANSVCQAVGLPASEKQGLLEAAGVPERLSRLEGLLAFHLAALASPDPAASRTVH